ncbi:hypothetical protein GM3708_2032 [Geminocystis sp. NIES-3708]|uniref:hypothetical protein n=1 Tax=Geminocystis sp. NIES-3708 TaxID=1615909 RepID=UPI0005FC84F8|nr:hypothetical protein [Geminocystis sp. NIES-3708]BAQ61626.1 hypothetical protein GM3708_2032 [Geminocystis sp. NIES-3708]
MSNNSDIQVINKDLVNVPLKFNLLEDNDIEQASIVFDAMRQYVKRYLKEKVDYGTIPYCGNKDVLFKAGAEKLIRLFKLRPTFDLIDKIVDYDKDLFHYHYRCSLFRYGDLVGQCDGLANSREKKFVKQILAKDYTIVNTICKMAQKRSLVGSVLIVCGASEYFTQDLED